MNVGKEIKENYNKFAGKYWQIVTNKKMENFINVKKEVQGRFMEELNKNELKEQNRKEIENIFKKIEFHNKK